MPNKTTEFDRYLQEKGGLPETEAYVVKSGILSRRIITPKQLRPKLRAARAIATVRLKGMTETRKILKRCRKDGGLDLEGPPMSVTDQ